MVFLLVVGTALLTAAGPVRDTLAPPDLAAYEAASASAGRDADAHVKLALWCEAHGLRAERVKHLALAVLNNPSHAMARGLMGLVAYRGRWQRPDAVEQKVQKDEQFGAVLAEYNARRAKAANTAEDQWKLALWCEEKELKAEAQAHLSTVVRLDPARDAAWKRLGYKKHEGRWITDTQLAAEKAEVQAQKEADRKWRPLLAKWRSWLKDKNQNKRTDAEQALAEVTDPRAVPSVWAVFARGDAAAQKLAVQLLGQIDSAGASRALATLAVFSDSVEVRRTATETLRRRDPREFANLLIALLRKPIKYEVRPVAGPGSPGALFVQGKQFNVQRLYAPPALPNIRLFAGEPIYFDGYGLPYVMRYTGQYTDVRHRVLFSDTMTLAQLPNFHPSDPAVAAVADQFRGDANLYHRLGPNNRGLFRSDPTRYKETVPISFNQVSTTTTPMAADFQIPIGRIMLEYEKSAAAAQMQLQSDVAAVDAYNTDVTQSNDRVVQVLNEVSGLDQGSDIELWKSWWVNLQGYAYTPPPEQPVPTVVQNVPLAYVPQAISPQPTPQAVGPSTTTVSPVRGVIDTPMPSCFGAGTLVSTLSGLKPIEGLRVGDRVLAQDLATGTLSYRPLVFVHHNPPSPTFLIKLAGETIVSSPFHRFWKARRGWVMARELKPGDTLRILGGLVEVESVEPGPVQPVFNLDVAEDADFFVGRQGALVHDNTLPDLRLAPFDAPPKLAAAAP